MAEVPETVGLADACSLMIFGDVEQPLVTGWTRSIRPYCTPGIAMCRRTDLAQTPRLWIAANELRRPVVTPLFQGLNQVLEAPGSMT